VQVDGAIRPQRDAAVGVRQSTLRRASAVRTNFGTAASGARSIGS
jgi:hypothetical protein